ELGLFPNSNRNMELEIQLFKLRLKKTGTLGHYNITVQEALEFRAMSGGLINHIVTGSERFPGHFIGPFHEITLSAKIIRFLLQYYSTLKLGDETYSSFFSRFDLKSNIFARWQLDDGKRINWPGIIKFFFEHRISLPSSAIPTSHYLAIVDWYKQDPQNQTYFHVKSRDNISKNILSTNADGSYHVELWEDRFTERG
ncbi:10553_t:CDS:2, partial [Racocetra persica]